MPELTFRTTGIRHGSRELLPADTEPAMVTQGNTVQRLLAGRRGAVEHFEADGDGVRVTWILRVPLPATAPLEIRARVGGMAYAGQTTGGLHFADTEETPQVRIGPATAVDAQGARWNLEVQHHDGLVTVSVPAAVLGAASYPLGIDPVIGPEFGLDQGVNIPASGGHKNPAVAFNGREYLVVWEKQSAIRGARFSPAGTQIGFGSLLLGSSGFFPSVAAGKDDFLVTWQAGTNNASVKARLVRADRTLGDSVDIASGFAYVRPYPRVASDGTNYLVVWHQQPTLNSNYDVFGALVSAQGTLVTNTPITVNANSANQLTPEVTCNGSHYLVVWQDWRNSGTLDDQGFDYGYDIFGARLDLAGKVAETPGRLICKTPGHQAHPVAAASGTDFLVAWEHPAADQASGPVYWTRMKDDGTVLEPNGKPLSTTDAIQTLPTVAGIPNGWLVAYQRTVAGTDGDIFGVRIGRDGTTLDAPASPIAISQAPWSQAGPRAAANDGGCLVVWQDHRDIRNVRLFGARVASDGTVADPNGLGLSTSRNTEDAPAIVSNGTGFLALWRDNRPSTFDTEYLSAVYGLRLSGTGEPQDLVPFAVSEPVADDPGTLEDEARTRIEAASDGTNYLTMWVNGRIVRTRRVVATGNPVSSSASIVVVGEGADARVAISGSEYLVTYGPNHWRSAGPIYGRRVGLDGALLDASAFAIGDGFDARVASNGSDYLVVYRKYFPPYLWKIVGVRISKAGAITTPTPFLVSRDSAVTGTVVAAAAGAYYLVVWQSDGVFVGQTDTERVIADNLSGVVVSPDGILPKRGVIQLALAGGAELLHDNPTISSDGSRFLVTWTDTLSVNNRPPWLFTSLKAVRLTPSGRLLDSQPIDLRGEGLTRNTPAVAYSRSTGKFFVLAGGLVDEVAEVTANLVTFTDFYPFMESASMVQGKPVLVWNARVGKIYRIQSRPTLNSGGWTDASSDIVAASNMTTWTDGDAAGLTARFYQAVELP